MRRLDSLRFAERLGMIRSMRVLLVAFLLYGINLTLQAWGR